MFFQLKNNVNGIDLLIVLCPFKCPFDIVRLVAEKLKVRPKIKHLLLLMWIGPSVVNFSLISSPSAGFDRSLFC